MGFRTTGASSPFLTPSRIKAAIKSELSEIAARLHDKQGRADRQTNALRSFLRSRTLSRKQIYDIDIDRRFSVQQKIFIVDFDKTERKQRRSEAMTVVSNSFNVKECHCAL